MICGSGEHWWRDCPDRHSKGKGKAHYLDEYEEWEEGWYGWSYAVISINFYSNFLFHMSTKPGSVVVVDTGATETAGGLDAVQSFVAALLGRWPNLEYWVDQNDRPWFKYAGGSWGRAMSRVHAKIPVIDWISVYTLEADTPVLLGSDLLDALGANLCYHTNHLTLKKVTLEPSVPVERAPSGHRLLDFCALPGEGSGASPEGSAE